jgi:hypothetical protein
MTGLCRTRTSGRRTLSCLDRCYGRPPLRPGLLNVGSALKQGFTSAASRPPAARGRPNSQGTTVRVLTTTRAFPL